MQDHSAIHGKGRSEFSNGIPRDNDDCIERYIMVTDIPGAFLHTDMNEDIHMIMEDTIVEHVVKLEPTIY